MRASIIAETGDARDVHHFAALIGFGASAIIPYVAFDVLRSLTQEGAFGDDTLDEVFRHYGQAVDTGILKIMSKMGISAVASYHGGQIFEALGVGDEVVAKCFPGTTTRIGGVGFDELAADVVERHQRAFPSEDALPAGGWYKFRRDADHHGHAPTMWRALHQAVAEDGSAEQYRRVPGGPGGVAADDAARPAGDEVRP